MVNPMSPAKFFIENKRKVTIIVITIILAVCAISLVSSLTGSLINSSKFIWIEPFEKYSLITPLQGEYFIKDSVVERIDKIEGTKKTIYIDVDFTTISLPFGGNDNVPVYFMEKEDIEYVLAENRCKLIEGRLPDRNANEVILHWRIMSNKNLKIGDYIGSLADKGEVLAGKYKITGIIDGDAVLSFGGESYKEKQLKKIGEIKNKMAILIFPENGSSTLNKELELVDGTDAKCYTYQQLKDKLEEQINGLNTTLLIIILVVVSVLSISVGALMYITYMQRTDEFGILYAIGYSKKYIIKKISKEIIYLNIFSWITGMILSFVFIFILNKTIYNPQGQVLTLFDFRELFFTLFIPIMVGVFSLYPIIRVLKKWDPISVIERRI